MSQKFDIVIIGAGTAGMACAIESAQRGATVAVIEKSHQVGGAMHWSGGHMSAGGTQLQRRNDIKDSIDDHYEDIIRINHSSGDLKLIRKAVEEAPITLNWLDDLKFPWAPECPRIIYGHVPYTKPRTQYGVNKAISIFETIKPLWDKGVATGHIRLFLNATFSGLSEVDDRYKIVHYHSANQEHSLEGEHIVITSGGYGSNHEYFKEKHGDIPYSSSAYPDSTGEVMIYMEQLDAAFRMADYHLPSLGGLELEPGSHRANFNEAWAMVLTSVYRQPRDIYVNSDGERFLAEDEINADTRERAVIQQKDWVFWVIFDEAGLMAKDDNGMDNPIIIGWDTDRIKEEATRGKAIFVADDIPALAAQTGLPAAALATTISAFNGMVDNGEDPDYGRSYLKHKISQAPYYAVKVFASLLVTFGGLAVNENLQILNRDSNVMPGLYGAGEVLGLGATSGDAFCSGMAITPALSFGRLLGRQLTD